MDLRIFFDPVSENLHKEKANASLFGANIRIFHTEFPNLDNISVAIFSVAEDRGTQTNTGASKGGDEIRKKLYALKKGSVKLHTADLGVLRSGETVEDTYLRVKEVCEVLMQLNILPVMIGGSHDLNYGQFLSYENTGKLINMLNIDAFIDMASSKDDQSRHHIHRILVHQPNIIFNYSHLAYQSYLNDQEVINVLEKLHFEAYRLGKIRENMEDMEPVVRDADMISIDVSAIRQTDAPGNKNSQPFGLTGEEACMICWYAGLSTKLTSIGFYEYNPEDDIKGQTAGVIATMIWYFMEGFYSRKEDTDVSGPQYTKYLVSIDSGLGKLVFFKNTHTEKWWMEVPYPEEKAKLARNSIVPCSYNDYLMANKGEVPDRWILTHAKLI